MIRENYQRKGSSLGTGKGKLKKDGMEKRREKKGREGKKDEE